VADLGAGSEGTILYLASGFPLPLKPSRKAVAAKPD
jgi:hypothetical protein